MKEMCDKMKIKFSKTLAIACILCMTFATLTAFADVTVTTTTTYDFEAAADADMTITTTVAGLENNGEITYYVENEDGIVYIDQTTAASKTATFTFVAATNAVLKATAKHGSDKGYAFPTFTFKAGANYLTQGTPGVAKVPNAWGVPNAGETKITDDGGYIFQGIVSGTGAEYGVQIEGYDKPFLAKGCNVDGTFVVIIDGISADDAAKAVPYPAEKVAAQN